jgi:hypothetical protein
MVLDLLTVAKIESSKTCHIARIVMGVFTLPFMAYGMIYPEWKGDQSAITFAAVKQVKTIVLHELVVVLIVSLGLGIIICTLFYARGIAEPECEPRKPLLLFNETDRWICNIHISGSSSLELAAVTMVVHSIEHLQATTNMLLYVLGDETNWEIESSIISESVPALMIRQISSQLLLAFQGVVSRKATDLLFENIIGYYFDMFLNWAIPFLSLIKDFFLSEFLCWAPRVMIDVFLGFSDISAWKLSEALRIAEVVQEVTGEIPLMTGHMSGGLIAKAVATQLGEKSVVFESPSLELSIMHDRSFGSTG